MSPIAIVVLLAFAAPLAPAMHGLSGREVFIVGASDRLALPGDRQQPRRYDRIESAIGAYADVDEVEDPTWLRHELEGYALRASDCPAHPRDICTAGMRQLGRAPVVQVISGPRAAVLWTCGHRAVRLAWRRIVDTPTGTMTVDDPPSDFATELLGACPSDLPAIAFDRAAWADAEIDRRLDYADRALDRCAMAIDTTGCLHFARASLLAVEVDDPALRAVSPASAEPTVVSVRLRVAAARLRRAAGRQSLLTPPMCAWPEALAPPRLAALP